MKLTALVLVLAACGREPAHISIGAAASLRHAMPELVEQYKSEGGVDVDVSYGASDLLGDQVSQGAALDAVVLADAVELDKLIAARAVAADSRRAIASNRIVLVGPVGAEIKFATLAALHDSTKIAVGDPATVPAGRYAKQYLETLGEWTSVQDQLVFGGDVAGVLALAKQGRARIAVVYRTDARAAAPLVVLDEPADAPTASIVAGIATHSRHAAAARAFAEFLASAQARQILARHGFAPPT
ncbi:MAG TPA: molybdate ABC transporter substrate-binding protein [Kofleriaceae bacterium]